MHTTYLNLVTYLNTMITLCMNITLTHLNLVTFPTLLSLFPCISPCLTLTWTILNTITTFFMHINNTATWLQYNFLFYCCSFSHNELNIHPHQLHKCIIATQITYPTPLLTKCKFALDILIGTLAEKCST